MISEAIVFTQSSLDQEDTVEVLSCDGLWPPGWSGDRTSAPPHSAARFIGHTLFFVAVIYGAPSVTATSIHNQVCVHGKTRHELLLLW